MSVSFENGDNFIRNMMTIPVGGGARAAAGRPTLDVVSTGTLPVDVEEIMEDLRVDDPEAEKDTVERFARGACAFIARRTGFVLLPTVFEVTLSSWWTGALQIERGPLRAIESVSYLAGRDDRVDVDPEAFWASSRSREIKVRFLDGFNRPDLWQGEDCVSLRFSAGFDAFDESGGDLPIEDGLRTILLMITGHYYQNRELLGLGDQKAGAAAVELGATSLLGQYRQFW